MAPPSSLNPAGLDANAKDPLRKVPARMEIDDWFLSENVVHQNQRALFFPAFLKFCEEDPQGEGGKFSFFQIAGIHGQPIIPWDEPANASEVQAREAGQKNRGSYCHHGETTFATWHRPYLLLLEQVIYEYMKDYAKTFSGKDRDDMLYAAGQWRLPYWDWAAKKPTDWEDLSKKWDYNLPVAFLEKHKEVEVKKPRGLGKVRNALYGFKMPGGLTMGDAKLKPQFQLQNGLTLRDGTRVTIPYSMAQGTSRYPPGEGVTKEWINGIQNNEALIRVLRDEKAFPKGTDKGGVVNESLRDAYARLFSIKRFEDFASTQPLRELNVADAVYQNVENLHNNMHVWCGGNVAAPNHNLQAQAGHMSNPSVAAFDPLFWFHHCNIDRTIAIWQEISEVDDIPERDRWFDKTRNKYSEKAVKADLRPFHRADGAYWTSNDARYITPLGYTYPILDKQPFIVNGVYQRDLHIGAINGELNTKYNTAREAAAKAALTADPGRSGPRLMKLSALMAVAPNPETALDQTVNDYAVNVVYEKMGFGGQPFTVNIFIGKVPTAIPFDFHDEEGSLVGQVYNFTSPDEGEVRCENCAGQAIQNTLATGRVVLTNSLITRWKDALTHTPDPGVAGPTVLASMEPTDVVPFLATNLHWRITAANGLVDFAAVPSVKVAVVVGKAEHFADNTKLSQYHGYRSAYEITAGKPGGVGPEDDLYPEGSEWRP
ncbi:common central domain of tyrosinase-domain-containing protein [Schizothecium vesticola]|uniref:tyrosinase n=1 Tax=Schizothecium vesticola TaxID=314040 RepID=A0AA40F239_9PEZI|nr:common central domain of tyrosinase-domain-containing protein [Schizothecium vesticola]